MEVIGTGGDFHAEVTLELDFFFWEFRESWKVLLIKQPRSGGFLFLKPEGLQQKRKEDNP